MNQTTKNGLFLSIIIISLFLFFLSFTGCTTKQDIEDDTSIQEIKPMEFKKHVDLASSSITYYDKNSQLYASQTSTIKESDDPFRIVDHGPVKELPVEVRHPTIYVLFSQPVVPLAKLGDVMTTSDIMSISPPISGIYRWYGSKILSFEPSEKYLPQREYRVSIQKSLKSLGGKTLTGETSFQFHTEYLNIVDFYPGSPYEGYSFSDVPLTEAKKITITFSYPVSIDVIKKYITITSKGKKYNFTLARPKDPEELNENYILRTIVLFVDEDFETNSEVIVTLAKGARSEADFIGTPGEIKRTFHTITPFIYKDYSTYSYSFPRSEKGDANPVYLNFSHPVDKESVRENISISLDLKNPEENIEVWGNQVKLTNLPITYGGSYTIDIGKKMRDIYGRELGKNYSIKITVSDASTYYYFPNYGTRMLESSFEPKIIYEHQNIFDGVWRIDKIDNPYSSFPPESLGNYDFSYAKKNVKHYRILDLSPWLNEEKKGWVGISWNFQEKKKDGTRPGWGQYNLQVQVTDLGITTRYGYNKIIVMVASLSSGKPVKGARVLLDTKDSLSLYEYTDKNGMALFSFQNEEYLKYFTTNSTVSQPRIFVENGSDKIVFIPNTSHDQYHFGIYNTTTINHAEDTLMKAFLYTDRGLYKPGETVTYSGIDRTLKLGQFSVYEGPYELFVKKNYWDAEPFYSTKGMTNENGSFSNSFQIPESLEPGSYTIQYKRNNQNYETNFQVAFFRRLTFGVHLKKPDIVYYTGDSISIKLNADYLAGGAMSNADYEYYWTKKLFTYVPPGKKWKEYRFGPNIYQGTVHVSSGSGKLSGSGQADINQKTSLETKGGTNSYECEARVTDIDRQMIASKTSLVVHPAHFYIGTKIDTGTHEYWSYFVPRGKKMSIAYAFATPDGDDYSPVKNQVLKARLYHVDWKVVIQKGVSGRMNQNYERVEELEEEQEVFLSASRGNLNFTPQYCGSYFIELESQDTKERDALTRLHFYSTGSSWIYWGFDNPQDIKLVADKEIYTPGEKVKLLVQSPLPKGTYLLTIEREGILEEKIIKLTGSANVIDIPVKKEFLPVFYVALSTYTGRTENPPDSYFNPDLGKPKGYFGITEIKVGLDLKRIDIEIIPEKKIYPPGSNVRVQLKATYQGKPVEAAELTFLAADRGVLDLINYHVPDPVASFYSSYNFPLGTTGADSRSLLLDPVTYDIKDLPGGGGKGAQEETGLERSEGEGDSGMNIRRDFRALAVFKHGLVTDARGTVMCDFNLPDTLTTYRMTAIAVNDDLFGKQEQELMVQNPLNVRTALNRRLRVRDTSFAGVVITNLDTRSHEVSVTAQSDIIKIDDEKTKTIAIPPNSSVEVPFSLLAVMAGRATITFTIHSEVLNEQLEEKIVIEKPLIKETFTITGKTPSNTENNQINRVDEGIIIPQYIAQGFGGLFLTLDSTRLASLSTSIDYLFDYPYGCVEQHLSRLLPLIVFGDKIEAFGLSSAVMNPKDTIEETLNTIARFQTNDGGVPFWMEGGYPSSSYCSVKLAHVAFLAQSKGYSTGSLDINKLLTYISGLTYPRYSRYINIYSLYVRSLYGKNVGSEAEQLFKDDEHNTLTTYGFLGLTFYNNKNKNRSMECLTKIKNYIKIGTRTIDIVEKDPGMYYFDSEVQKLSLLLMLYNELDPESEFIEKITLTLMKRQKSGYWVNTADTGWALTAFAQIFKNEVGVKTDFIAKVLINEQEILKTPFKGISKKSYTNSFLFDGKPLSEFRKDTLLPFSFLKEGKGTLFYNASLTYALPTEVIRARDEGFSIYTEILNSNGKVTDPSELSLGATYTMRGVISSSKRHNFVVVRVPIPSGGEILDASFVTTGSYKEQGGIDANSYTGENAYGDESSVEYFTEDSFEYSESYSYYQGYGPRKIIMDNEVQYFFDDFMQGKQEVNFLFRITTPGIYPTPPAFAECMYEEEIFGRSDGRIYLIKD